MVRSPGKTSLSQQGGQQAVAPQASLPAGRFFYAVKTTGIYCRPGCASRRPNPENVLYFFTCDDAERAGYRACKRCRPRENPSSPPPAIVHVCRLIETAKEPPSLKELAAAVNLSPFHLHRLFKSAVGVTPKQYAVAQRTRRLQQGLPQEKTVVQAILQAGYRSGSRCYDQAGNILGMSPAEYQQGARGVRIRSTIVESSLGWLLVAATDRGVCLMEFADQADKLREGLAARFPRAELIEGDAEFVDWVQQAVRLVAKPTAQPALPLDIQGTAFQQRVWQTLQAIPPGKTVTYTEIAELIGRPRAVRAVASAIASNPVAVVIPCHRVIGRSGELRGYRWGLNRKQTLIEQERRQAEESQTSQQRKAAKKRPKTSP